MKNYFCKSLPKTLTFAFFFILLIPLKVDYLFAEYSFEKYSAFKRSAFKEIKEIKNITKDNDLGRLLQK